MYLFMCAKRLSTILLVYVYEIPSADETKPPISQEAFGLENLLMNDWLIANAVVASVTPESRWSERPEPGPIGLLLSGIP